MRIGDYLQKEEFSLAATSEIFAGVRENFEDDPKGGHTCKLCGDHVDHPRAAAAHLGVHHRKELESSGMRGFEKVQAGIKCKSCGKVIKAGEMVRHMKSCSK